MENKDQCVILKKKEYDQLLSDSKNMTGIITIQYRIDYGMYGTGISFYDIGQPQRFVLGEKLLSQIKKIASSFPDVFKEENQKIISSIRDRKDRDVEEIKNDYAFKLNVEKSEFYKRQEEFDEFKQKIAKMGVFEFIKFRKTLKENT